MWGVDQAINGGLALSCYARLALHGMLERETARGFGEALGVAFQLGDDVLGVWGDRTVIGKLSNDLVELRLGLPVVLGLRGSPRVRETLKALWAQPPYPEAKGVQRLLEQEGVREEAASMI